MLFLNPMDEIIDYFWIVGLPAVLLGILALSHFMKRRRARRLTEFARSRGWRCSHSWGLTGPGTRYTIRPETGNDWELRVRRRTSGQRTSIAGRAEFRADSPRFPGGFVIFTDSGVSNRGLRVLAAVFRILGRVLGRPLTRWLYGAELGESIRSLQAFEPPDGIDLGIFATTDPCDKFDLDAISRAVHAMGDGRRLRPSVRIGNGLQVVEEFGVEFPGTGEDFIAGCHELRNSLLGRSPSLAPSR